MGFVGDGSRKLGYPCGVLKKHYTDYTSAALLDVNVLSFIIETFFVD